jgi:hypothetical protein
VADDDNRTGDEMIDKAEEAERKAREERAASLFDLRKIIGGLFLLYGVVLFILGLSASDADLKRADGVNVNLTVGIGLLVVSALFWVWALTRPLARELEEAGPPEGS